MRNLTIGKIRGLSRVGSDQGLMVICAMDHRGSFKRMINPENPGMVSYGEMVSRKLELCSSLAEHASAVLLDPVFGAAQCIASGVLPKTTGLLISIEASGYDGGEANRITGLLESWGVEKIKRMGASAVKILLYYRPELEQVAAKQRDTVARVAAECHKHDIPFLVEPKGYPIGAEISDPEKYAAAKEEFVIATARDIASLQIDVLKAEFPADLSYQKDPGRLAELCKQLDAASPVPWVILSGGLDFKHFATQVEIACQAGASGFLAGRAIWQEVMEIADAGERVKYLSTVAAGRIKQLTEIAGHYAAPWYRKFGLTSNKLATIEENWYCEY